MRILENLAQIGLMANVDLKYIFGAWIEKPDMQMVFKFQVNRMKIEDIRKFGLLAYVYLKINRWLNSSILCTNDLQISCESDENWGFQKQF